MSPSMLAAIEVIERLRALKHDTSGRVTVAQLRVIRDGLLAISPLDDIAEKSGLEPDDVLSEVAELGTWCTHVWKGADAEIIPSNVDDQMLLFQDATEKRQVRIPIGFERRPGQRRDVSKALAAIVVHSPSDDDLRRCLSRRFASDTQVLGFEDLTIVHRLSQLGRLSDIEDFAAAYVPLAHLFVAAYDTLDIARRDAIAGVTELTSTHVRDIGVDDLPRLSAAVSKCRWLGEANLSRLERCIDMATRSDSSQAWKLLEKELRFLEKSAVAVPGQWAPSSIAMLNDGQVQRIAVNVGLDIDAAVRRAEESEVRKRLGTLGLRSDADKLVPQALRAVRSGLGDSFWEALERRSAGDPRWEADLRELTVDIDAGALVDA